LEEYLREHAGLFFSGRLQHPYLFVNTDRRKSTGCYGAPIRMENVRSVFYRAAERIGIRAHPHMARHHSGHYLASVAETDLELARQILRHACPQSTSVYFSTHPDAVRRRLQDCLRPGDDPLESAVQLARPSFPAHWSLG
jgi:integrase